MITGMKVLFCLLIGFVGISAFNETSEELFQEEWKLYKLKYNKNYSDDEEETRLSTYLNKRFLMVQHNIKYAKGEETYEMGINRFTDMSAEEVNQIFNGAKIENSLTPLYDEAFGYLFPDPDEYANLDVTAPDEINWVTKGAVSQVYDQGHCGSCYAFAATGALEGALFVKTKTLSPLSMQNIVDCSGKSFNLSCHGGTIAESYLYIKKNGGINYYVDYPYEAKEGTCRFDPQKPVGEILNFAFVKPNDEKELQAAVSVTPIAALIDASPASFHAYKGGVYSDCTCGGKINHGVTIVGYGHDNQTNQDYWLIKNSWGPDWGEKGFMRLARNANNMCSIALHPIIPF